MFYCARDLHNFINVGMHLSAAGMFGPKGLRNRLTVLGLKRLCVADLQFLNTMGDHNQKMLRWWKYSLVIRHRSWRSNFLPDFFGRPGSKSSFWMGWGNVVFVFVLSLFPVNLKLLEVILLVKVIKKYQFNTKKIATIQDSRIWGLLGRAVWYSFLNITAFLNPLY